ncbi:MAG: hypothetical protein AB7I18_11495 [Candidatus Berkiella sp.]
MPYANTVDAVNKLINLRIKLDDPLHTNLGLLQYYGFWVAVSISYFVLNLAPTVIEPITPGVLTSIGVPTMVTDIITFLIFYKLAVSTLLNYFPEVTLLSTGNWISVKDTSVLIDVFKKFNFDAAIRGANQLNTPNLQNNFVQHLYDTNDLANLELLTKIGLDKQIITDRQLQTKREEDLDAQSVCAKHSNSLTWLAAKSIVKNKVAVNTDDSSLTHNSLKIIEKARVWVK